MMAVAALAACTKSEVQYEPAGEIGFAPFSETSTKAAESTTDYNDELALYVFANAGTADAAPGDYTEAFLDNAKFGNRAGLADNIFGGDPDPYYWPNVKKLVFAGVSQACNVNTPDGVIPKMDFKTNTLSIDGYVQSPGTTLNGDNDLMWFSTTAPYGKQTAAVPVKMSHACSWITVKLCGDAVTAKAGSAWEITNITINGLTTKGDVELGATTESADGSPNAAWTLSEEASYKNQTFVVFNGNKPLTTAATEAGYETIANNTVVLPQGTTNMDITYSYETPAGDEISETANVSLAYNGTEPWKAGYHYIYTVTIKASEILIEPSSKTWTDGGTIPDKEI